jgi:hypothetical protein
MPILSKKKIFEEKTLQRWNKVLSFLRASDTCRQRDYGNLIIYRKIMVAIYIHSAIAEPVLLLSTLGAEERKEKGGIETQTMRCTKKRKGVQMGGMLKYKS